LEAAVWPCKEKKAELSRLATAVEEAKKEELNRLFEKWGWKWKAKEIEGIRPRPDRETRKAAAKRCRGDRMRR
jgi:hypothetical protein